MIKDGNMSFWLRFSISLIACVFMIGHIFFPALKVDVITLGLLAIAVLPWFSTRFETIEFPGGVKVKLKGQEEATEFIPVSTPEPGATEIKYDQKSKPFILEAKDDPPLLFLRARINYNYESGSQYLMKIIVNGKVLNSTTLINKPEIKKYIGGREWQWYNTGNQSWFLSYSPNFKSNYFNHFYKVINGDPYIFIFDLSSIEAQKDNKYEVIIQHNGMTGHEAYRNSLIVKDVVIL
ncbi:hypothetical protein ACFL6K_03960 [Candidatus Latescibacterota bacterium]